MRSIPQETEPCLVWGNGRSPWYSCALWELRAPWIDQDWDAARTELFLAALDLHKAFALGEPAGPNIESPILACLTSFLRLELI